MPISLDEVDRALAGKMLPIVAAIAAGGPLWSCACCGGCLYLLRPAREPAAAAGAGSVPRPAQGQSAVPRKSVPPDVLAEVERIIPAEDWPGRKDGSAQAGNTGALSGELQRVLENGTLADFMSLRAEQRLALCHAVASRLHPDRSADQRAARGRTFFDQLQMTFYTGNAEVQRQPLRLLAGFY